MIQIKVATTNKKERWLHYIFVASVIGKGINGLFETFVGIALITLTYTSSWVMLLIQNELVEDPTDTVAILLQATAPQLLKHLTLFSGIYLLSYGIVKLFLMYELFRNRAWVYRRAFYILSLFVLYQLYRIIRYHSLVLTILTIFDIFLVYLVYREYRRIKIATAQIENTPHPEEKNKS